MERQLSCGSSRLSVVSLLMILFIVGALSLGIFARPGSDLSPTGTVIARGGGTTIIQGGTGAAGGFEPVLTTIAFHAEKQDGAVTGGFECLARAPEATATGAAGSAQFTVNVMYVTGQITGAVVSSDSTTLTGTANITGLGAGSNVSFTFELRKGGPGAKSVLKVASLSAPFNEILIEGRFEVPSGGS
jgi:hypothetical protein